MPKKSNTKEFIEKARKIHGDKYDYSKVEYQGRQHFGPTVRFGDEERYKITYERDLRKYQKCKENGIKLYYISFEKQIPNNYFVKIYTNINDLIYDIKKEKVITLQEYDIHKIVKNVLEQIL